MSGAQIPQWDDDQSFDSTVSTLQAQSIKKSSISASSLQPLPREVTLKNASLFSSNQHITDPTHPSTVLYTLRTHTSMRGPNLTLHPGVSSRSDDTKATAIAAATFHFLSPHITFINGNTSVNSVPKAAEASVESDWRGKESRFTVPFAASPGTPDRQFNWIRGPHKDLGIGRMSNRGWKLVDTADPGTPLATFSYSCASLTSTGHSTLTWLGGSERSLTPEEQIGCAVVVFAIHERIKRNSNTGGGTAGCGGGGC